ncbi:helix-hairpin-helix domain-containing protein [Lacticaseibacillus porcinae]|uniref:helix-hairpin-helix domain-containing protein n=1 Tax=Lacticaseibacillus porcinae TaxID=1123687 RepID=UPI000F78A570|nr:helix-hairpin-helix domain-containing protein [Lacticaseibacillus porcinae]
METFKLWLKQYGVIAVLATAALGFIWWQGQKTSNTNDLAPVAESATMSITSSVASTTSASASRVPQAGYVEIKGAVLHPGLYPVDGTTTRWDAVVKAAGGLTSNADASTINLAAVAHDQESLLIPVIGAAAASTTTPPQSASSGVVENSSTNGHLVNLNTATSEELQTLSGVGPKKAEDIIAYRDANGGFQSIDDLKSVSGIGDKTFEKLAPFITVGP